MNHNNFVRRQMQHFMNLEQSKYPLIQQINITNKGELKLYFNNQLDINPDLEARATIMGENRSLYTLKYRMRSIPNYILHFLHIRPDSIFLSQKTFTLNESENWKGMPNIVFCSEFYFQFMKI